MGNRVHLVVLGVAVAACLFVAFGCANEGVSKSAAVQASGIAAVTTGAIATVATGGWAILVGFVSGLMRLLMADSTTTAAPGATAERVTALGVPLWLIFLLILAFVKRNRLWALVTGGTHGRLDALLRLLGLRTKPPPLPKILKQGVH